MRGSVMAVNLFSKYHFIAPEIAAACFSICVSLSISICSKIADRINSACASRNITKSPDEVEICKSPNATLLFSSETVLIFESGVSIDCLLINPLTPNNRLFVKISSVALEDMTPITPASPITKSHKIPNSISEKFSPSVMPIMIVPNKFLINKSLSVIRGHSQ